jgi:hypothetical protein
MHLAGGYQMMVVPSPCLRLNKEFLNFYLSKGLVDNSEDSSPAGTGSYLLPYL